MAKIIIGGELFLKYDPAMNQLVYLINKQKSDQRIQRRLTMSDKGQQLFSKGSMLSQQSLASLPSLGKEDSLNKMDSLDSELLGDIEKIESKQEHKPSISIPSLPHFNQRNSLQKLNRNRVSSSVMLRQLTATSDMLLPQHENQDVEQPDQIVHISLNSDLQ